MLAEYPTFVAVTHVLDKICQRVYMVLYFGHRYRCFAAYTTPLR